MNAVVKRLRCRLLEKAPQPLGRSRATSQASSAQSSPASMLGVTASARQRCPATAPHASLTVTQPTTSHPSSANFTYATSPNHSRGEQRCHCLLACYPRVRLRLPRCCTICLRRDRLSRHLHVPSNVAHSHAASHPYVTSHHGRSRGYTHLWRRAQGMSPPH